MATFAELWDETKPQTPAGGVITDKLLDNLKRVESGGNAKAVNKDSGAMGAYQFMPDTVKALNQQGIKFDPFDEQQSRGAAKQYLENLVKQTGSLDQALAAYGGFKTKDPTAYVQAVKGDTGQKSTATSGNFADMWEATSPGQPIQVSTAGAGRGSYEGYSQKEEEAAGKVKTAPITFQSAINQPGTAVKQILGKAIKGAFDTRRELGERAAGALDVAYEALPAAYGAVQQALVRPFTTPERAEELGKQAGEFMFPSQPVGKLLNITGKETYQKPLGGATEPIQQAVNRMANVLGMTPEQISEKQAFQPLTFATWWSLVGWLYRKPSKKLRLLLKKL